MPNVIVTNSLPHYVIPSDGPESTTVVGGGGGYGIWDLGDLGFGENIWDLGFEG